MLKYRYLKITLFPIQLASENWRFFSFNYFQEYVIPLFLDRLVHVFFGDFSILHHCLALCCIVSIVLPRKTIINFSKKLYHQQPHLNEAFINISSFDFRNIYAGDLVQKTSKVKVLKSLQELSLRFHVISPGVLVVLQLMVVTDRYVSLVAISGHVGHKGIK